ncbi:MAG: hypothetical protein QM724_13565 [Flavobacteriales bacterium]
MGRRSRAPALPLHGILAEAGGALLGYQQAVRAETFRAAGDGSHVPHVGDAVQRHDQRVFTTVIGLGDHLVQVLHLHLADQGDHALVLGAGKAVQLFQRNGLPGHLTLARQVLQVADAVATGVAADQEFLDVQVAAQGLHYGVHPADQVVLRHRQYCMIRPLRQLSTLRYQALFSCGSRRSTRSLSE